MRVCASSGDREAIDRAHDALRRVRDLTIEPSLTIGLAGAGRLLIVEERLPDDYLRAHLICDEGYRGSGDVDASARFDCPDDVRRVADAIDAGSLLTATDPGHGHGSRDRIVIARWLAMTKSVAAEFFRVPD